MLSLAVACGPGQGREPAPMPREARSSAEILPPHHYRLELEDETASVTLWLPHSEEPIEVDLPQLPGRSERRTQIEDLRCDGAALPASSAWRLPMGCRVLTWRVRFQAPPPEGVDPAARRAVRDPERRWWFLPGAAVFIRPEGSTSPGTVDIRAPEALPVFHRLPPSDRLGYELPPPPASGRVLLGFGGFVERETGDGATTYRHLFDREPSVEPTTVTAQHAQGAAYLARVTGARPPAAIDIYWFGQSAARRTVSGAAGVDAVAAGFLVGELSADAPAHARHAALLVLLHEQFHLLAGGRLPAWASESLAHYYALEALVHGQAMTEVELEAFVNDAAAAQGEGTLLEAQRVYAAGGAGAADAYARFYTRGAAFWRELDVALRAASEGQRTLDDLLRDILGLVFVEGGAPPARFLELVRAAGVEQPEAITHRHLGWPAG